jgi:hypothetical protein
MYIRLSAFQHFSISAFRREEIITSQSFIAITASTRHKKNAKHLEEEFRIHNSEFTIKNWERILTPPNLRQRCKKGVLDPYTPKPVV